AEHTSLGPLAQAAAETMGFDISPDPMPEEVRFIRSDQYSFVRSGVPSISIKTGNISSDPAIDGAKATHEWLRTIYHSVRDDMTQHFDWATGTRYTQVNFLLAWSAANAPEKPRWVEGDFFGKKFSSAVHPDRPSRSEGSGGINDGAARLAARRAIVPV